MISFLFLALYCQCVFFGKSDSWLSEGGVEDGVSTRPQGRHHQCLQWPDFKPRSEDMEEGKEPFWPSFLIDLVHKLTGQIKLFSHHYHPQDKIGLTKQLHLKKQTNNNNLWSCSVFWSVNIKMSPLGDRLLAPTYCSLVKPKATNSTLQSLFRH